MRFERSLNTAAATNVSPTRTPERGMLASPIKINQRIGMGLGLQQLRDYLALQTAEAVVAPTSSPAARKASTATWAVRFTLAPGIREATVAVGGERTGDGATPRQYARSRS